MSSITFQCTSCDNDFDLEIAGIIERPTSIKCTSCGSRIAASRATTFATALEDLLAAMAEIRNKVRFELAIDSEEMPPPYGSVEEEEDEADGVDDDEVGDVDDEDLGDDLDEDDEDGDEELGFEERDVEEDY